MFARWGVALAVCVLAGTVLTATASRGSRNGFHCWAGIAIGGSVLNSAWFRTTAALAAHEAGCRGFEAGRGSSQLLQQWVHDDSSSPRVGVSALDAADGTRAIEVYPPGGAATDSLPSPTEPAQSVYAADDYTGHGPGAQLVCGYFPASSANAFLDHGSLPCPALPTGTSISHVTPDLVTFRSSDGRTGVVIYPQLPFESEGGTNVTMASCRLIGKRDAPCQSILNDYTLRAYPAQPAP